MSPDGMLAPWWRTDTAGHRTSSRQLGDAGKEDEMMNLAQRGAIARARTRTATLDQADDLLELSPEGMPQTVYVMDVDGKPGFGLSEEGPFFTEGLKWKPRDLSYDLFIEFVLLKGIDQIEKPADPLIYRSQRFDTDNKQALAVKAELKTYEFKVVLSNGARHDPKIVITPQ